MDQRFSLSCIYDDLLDEKLNKLPLFLDGPLFEDPPEGTNGVHHLPRETPNVVAVLRRSSQLPQLNL